MVPSLALPAGVDESSVFRSLFVAYPDSLLLVDQGGAIVMANPAAAKLLGYTVDELAGLIHVHTPHFTCVPSDCR
jgi:PAS domain S-box-containing protein